MPRVLFVDEPFEMWCRGQTIEDAETMDRILSSPNADKVREIVTPTREEAEQRDREDAIASARAMPLPDGVYALGNFNMMRRDPHRIDLFEFFAPATRDEIEHWIQRSRKLASDAYWVGDADLGRNPRYEDIKKAFVLDNPGFNQATYDDAIYRGTVAALH